MAAFTFKDIFLVLISVRGWVDFRAISWAGKIMPIKKSKNTIGIRTRDFPAYSEIPPSTAPARAPIW